MFYVDEFGEVVKVCGIGEVKEVGEVGDVGEVDGSIVVGSVLSSVVVSGFVSIVGGSMVADAKHTLNVLINGYFPSSQNFPFTSSVEVSQIITPPRFLLLIKSHRMLRVCLFS